MIKYYSRRNIRILATFSVIVGVVIFMSWVLGRTPDSPVTTKSNTALCFIFLSPTLSSYKKGKEYIRGRQSLLIFALPKYYFKHTQKAAM